MTFFPIGMLILDKSYELILSETFTKDTFNDGA